MKNSGIRRPAVIIGEIKWDRQIEYARIDPLRLGISRPLLSAIGICHTPATVGFLGSIEVENEAIEGCKIDIRIIL